MNISILGLGYVGCVSAGCLAKNGHNVIGVDISEIKVELINKGISPIVEFHVDELISEAVNKNLLRAVLDADEAIQKSDISIICVATPSTNTGHLDLEHIFNTAKSIGKALKNKKSFHTIAIRSTVSPGTNENVSRIIAEESQKTDGVDFAVASNPEFLREGSAVSDYENPPYTIIGTKSDRAFAALSELYKNVKAPILRTSVETAELIKYVNNTFHALKITFANEIGNICSAVGADANELMNIFINDTKLNISSAYLKPGMAYGGSCLPKDLLGLNRIAHDNYIDVPVISAIEKSNEIQKQNVFNKVVQFGKQRIGIIGLAFKAGTDDLRYSPSVDLVERLLGKGYKVRIYDKNINLSRLLGKNKSFIEEKLPHLALLLSENLEEVISNSEVIVFTQKYLEAEKECFKMNKHVIKFYN